MKKIISLLSALSISLFVAAPAFAMALPCPTDNGGGSARNFSTLCHNLNNPSGTLSAILTAILIAVVLIALVFLIWGGVKWVMSGGDKSKVETARNTIIGAIVGLIIAFLAFFIITFVGKLFGVQLFGGSGNLLDNLQVIKKENGSSGAQSACPVDVANYGGAASGSCFCPDGTTDTGSMCSTKS